MTNIQHERFFFNTFGYSTIGININSRKDLLLDFERDISKGLNKPYIGNKDSHNGVDGRFSNIRYSNFKSGKIYDIFYNPHVLDEIYKITDDFVICSPMESFYLSMSGIHRDVATEVKNIKLLFYLDDVSNDKLGPLYVIPGTQNMYDKYSSSLGDVVSWPPPIKGGGGGFEDNELGFFLEKNIPKKYILTNYDKIIMFNSNILHGSDGNLIQPTKLRRAIGMTIICVDRNNEILMKKIDNFFNMFNIDNINEINTNAYNFCKKHNRERWLKHFYLPSSLNLSFNHSEDGTDKNALILANSLNRWNNYIDNLNEINNKEEMHNTIFNCYKEQIKTINKLNALNDIQGI